MNISEIYGKKVESTAGKTGYVISVNANGERLECLICADKDENEFAVDIKNIISVGDKIIFEDRESAIKSSTPIRLGRAGYGEDGGYIGNLEEVTYSGSKLLKAKIGKKKYSAAEIVCGDIIIVKGANMLKQDVIKDGKVIFRKGTRITGEVLAAAEKQGEYIQTNLKSL